LLEKTEKHLTFFVDYNSEKRNGKTSAERGGQSGTGCPLPPATPESDEN
jgi:hypothetical protein